MTPRQRKKLCSQIAAVLKKNKTFFLTGHEKPDGDTVASELAMASLLRRMGKMVFVYNFEKVPESLKFLPGTEKIQASKRVDGKFDVAIAFECNDSARFGNIIDLRTQAGTVINVDHHLHNTNFGDINWVNSGASSNSEQLFYLFEHLKMPINKDEASCLYTGIMTDTGRFHHSNTNTETLRIASHLVARGVDVAYLCEKIYSENGLGWVKLLGQSISTLEMRKDGRIASMRLAKGDYAKVGASEEETEDIVNYGLQIPTAVISILFKESPSGGQVKISFRARRNVDVSSLARRFGGGGHKYASGCTIPGPLEAAMPKVLKLADDLLDLPSLSFEPSKK